MEMSISLLCNDIAFYQYSTLIDVHIACISCSVSYYRPLVVYVNTNEGR